MSEALTPTATDKLVEETAMKRPLNLGEEEITNSQEVKKVKLDEEAPPPMQGRQDRPRKVALLLAYCGAGYYGIQIQKDYPTIESELLSSLVKGNFITQEHADSPQKIQFQRAARTDKGVSALGNVISLKIPVDSGHVAEKINQNLPDQIRVIGYIRATRGFNSKNFCDARTYMYMIPTYAFAGVEKMVSDEYRIDDESMQKLQSVLNKFKGTHNFHNFTSGVKPTESCAKRYIISFEAGKPVVEDGTEFITLVVKGQSFMLHHIRKMVALTVSVLRGMCGIETIDKAWLHDKMDVPKAPSEGLFLYQTHYDGYNKRYGADGIHDPIDWSNYKVELDEFQKKYITSHIVKSEKQDRIVLNWLKVLHLHKFDMREDQEHKRTTKEMYDIIKAASASCKSDNSANSTNQTTTDVVPTLPDSSQDDCKQTETIENIVSSSSLDTENTNSTRDTQITPDSSRDNTNGQIVNNNSLTDASVTMTTLKTEESKS
ncbi:hypothetical protein SNE40_007781 [Patella caerulea]|uniref:Pseudouridylate synthase 1 homolog n=1 Tax=Patella caerulea TaxID=87958 RepID=A0AAN8PU71_PATCE